MRRIILVLILIFHLLITAQTNSESESIKNSLDALFKHIEVNNIEVLKPYLSENVKVSGHDGIIALTILESIPFQLKAPDSYEITDMQLVDINWNVNVKAVVSKEPYDYDFLFDKEFKFQEINMFNVQIKEQTEDKNSKLIKPLRIPFSMEDNIILLKASIKGIDDTLNLVFDTGATTFVLDSIFASNNNIKPLSQQKGTGAGGSSSYSIANVEALQINDFELKNLTTVLVDLTHLDKISPIDGIIGNDFLNKYVGMIDYDRRELVFYNDINEIKKPYANKLNFDFENGIPIPQTLLSIKLKSGLEFSGKVFMDTGANPNFVLNSNITRDNNLLELFDPKVIASFQTLTGEDELFESSLLSLNFMQENHTDVPISIPLSKEGVNTFPNILGILGNGIMNRYNWIFDYSELTAYYEPNSLNNSKFEYPCTDFRINREGNKMLFESVQPNSELDKKGIEDGMEINSINGYGIEAYPKLKALLKKEGVKLKIKYFSKRGKLKKMRIKTERKI